VQHEFTAGLELRFFLRYGDIRFIDLISPQPFQPMGGNAHRSIILFISYILPRSRDAYDRRVATISRILLPHVGSS